MAITQIRIDLFRVCFLPTAFSKAIAINVDARIIKIKKKEKNVTWRGFVLRADGTR